MNFRVLLFTEVDAVLDPCVVIILMQIIYIVWRALISITKYNLTMCSGVY